MSISLSKNLLKQTAVNRSRGNRYYEDQTTPPEAIKNETTRQVKNDSLKLLIPIIEHTSLSMFAISPMSSEAYLLQKDDLRVQHWNALTHSSWIVTYSTMCGEETTLNLFDAKQEQLCTIFCSSPNQHAWSLLLNALPATGEEL